MGTDPTEIRLPSPCSEPKPKLTTVDKSSVYALVKFSNSTEMATQSAILL